MDNDNDSIRQQLRALREDEMRTRQRIRQIQNEEQSERQNQEGLQLYIFMLNDIMAQITLLENQIALQEQEERNRIAERGAQYMRQYMQGQDPDIIKEQEQKKREEREKQEQEQQRIAQKGGQYMRQYMQEIKQQSLETERIRAQIRQARLEEEQAQLEEEQEEAERQELANELGTELLDLIMSMRGHIIPTQHDIQFVQRQLNLFGLNPIRRYFESGLYFRGPNMKH